ncbi:MAG: hypothetical protein PV362_10120 [Providencia heimbachae]|nr:hypothetical protein [Providencia heimbachae]
MSPSVGICAVEELVRGGPAESAGSGSATKKSSRIHSVHGRLSCQMGRGARRRQNTAVVVCRRPIGQGRPGRNQRYFSQRDGEGPHAHAGLVSPWFSHRISD